MIYPNTREGRNQILDEIARLVSNGFTREDRYNESVMLKKAVKLGKVCKELEVVRFIFKPELCLFVSETRVERTGIDKAKSLLFGWSSYSIEVSNAVKAGLLNDNDREILKADCPVDSWDRKNN